MSGPPPKTSDEIPHVVPTMLAEIIKVGREHGVSPAGFYKGARPAFGKEHPYGSVEDWETDGEAESAPLMVGMCRAWIRCFGRNQRVAPRSGTSYGLKHEVEQHFDKYINNGSFIVAGYLEGLIVQRTEHGSPNAYFNLNLKDLKNKAERLKAMAASSQ